ncbi:hypothetical protein Q8F55_005418 [Vanrija albida]|uniref:VWFA domain-containing protein n=1 Tax=Vanrija albida TaxID=181172 RepID=A0ABR3Q1T5_9TREE
MPLFASGPSVDSVISRLGSTKDTTAHYIAVSEYVESKKRRGKSVSDVNTKLDELERAVAKVSETLAADTAGMFAKLRDDKGLPRSKLFPANVAAPAPAPPPAYLPPIDLKPTPAPAPPPAAAAHVRAGSSSSAGALMFQGEEALAMLKDYDTAFLIDDSGSMSGARWQEARKAIQGVVAHAIQYDEDGVDIYFLNDKSVGKGVKSVAEVEALFNKVRPYGATPTGARLEKLLNLYRNELNVAYTAGKATGDLFTVKPLNLVIITDGAPTDDPEPVIVTFARFLDKYDYPVAQFGIQMFQIGNDNAATAALEELDDALENRYKIRDIVDTVPFQGEMTAETIVKVLLGGINRRMDRKKT